LERLSLRNPSSTRSAAPPPPPASLDENQNLMKRLYSSLWTLKGRWSGESITEGAIVNSVNIKGKNQSIDLQKNST
jgi:hypothetical protein